MKKTLTKPASKKSKAISRKKPCATQKMGPDECLDVAAKMLHLKIQSVECAAALTIAVVMHRVGKLTASQYASQLRSLEKKYKIKLTKAILAMVGDSDIELLKALDQKIK